MNLYGISAIIKYVRKTTCNRRIWQGEDTMKNTIWVETLVKEVWRGIDYIDIAPIDRGKIILYIKCDGLYDSDGIRRYRFKEEYSENCITAAVRCLKTTVSTHTSKYFVNFPTRKDKPMIVTE